jgi:hypothetical protein
MEISVGTSARPRAGIVMSFALYKSCPAAYALPLVGARALSDRSRTCSCCSALAAAAMLGAIGAGVWRDAMSMALDSGVGVAVPEMVLLSGDGSITFVRFGRGELGREGGSWDTEGVADGSDIFCVWLGGEVGCVGRKVVKDVFDAGVLARRDDGHVGKARVCTGLDVDAATSRLFLRCHSLLHIASSLQSLNISKTSSPHVDMIRTRFMHMPLKQRHYRSASLY